MRKLLKAIDALEISRKCKVSRESKVKNRLNSNSISMNYKGIFTNIKKLLAPGIKGQEVN